MKALHYPILKLSIFLAIGILVSDFLVVSIPTILGTIGFICFVLIQGIHCCSNWSPAFEFVLFSSISRLVFCDEYGCDSLSYCDPWVRDFNVDFDWSTPTSRLINPNIKLVYSVNESVCGVGCF
jgi:hypothetical protein